MGDERLRNIEKGKSRQLITFYKYILIMITIFLLVFTMNSICFANNEDENSITKDFKLSSCISIDNGIQYGVYVKKDNENILLSINAADYNLPSNLYEYKDNIRLRVIYLQDNYEVLDCKVINLMTDEIIEDLSEENINKLFNIEYGKNVIEKNWADKIKLSDLNENEIYKYTANSTTQFPEIENDIGKNCLIYIKGRLDYEYKKQINMYKEILSFSAISGSFNEYSSGESFNIMYKVIENEELLKIIEEDKIIYLSNYNDGDLLKIAGTFVEYIYNDTEKDIAIHSENMKFEGEKSDCVVIEKGKIYGFHWMIKAASISYAHAEDNTEKNENAEDKNDNKEQNGEMEEENKKDENSQIEQPKEDNSISSSKIPQAGTKSSLFIVILSLGIMIVIGIKLRKFKDIE